MFDWVLNRPLFSLQINIFLNIKKAQILDPKFFCNDELKNDLTNISWYNIIFLITALVDEDAPIHNYLQKLSH